LTIILFYFYSKDFYYIINVLISVDEILQVGVFITSRLIQDDNLSPDIYIVFIIYINITCAINIHKNIRNVYNVYCVINISILLLSNFKLWRKKTFDIISLKSSVIFFKTTNVSCSKNYYKYLQKVYTKLSTFLNSD